MTAVSENQLDRRVSELQEEVDRIYSRISELESSVGWLREL